MQPLKAIGSPTTVAKMANYRLRRLSSWYPCIWRHAYCIKVSVRGSCIRWRKIVNAVNGVSRKCHVTMVEGLFYPRSRFVFRVLKCCIGYSPIRVQVSQSYGRDQNITRLNTETAVRQKCRPRYTRLTVDRWPVTPVCAYSTWRRLSTPSIMTLTDNMVFSMSHWTAIVHIYAWQLVPRHLRWFHVGHGLHCLLSATKIGFWPASLHLV